MNVSPLDLRQQHFGSAMRGYDKVEVTSFLLAVADDYEAALRETDRLKQEVSKLEGLLNEHREQERSLKGTLMAAQKLGEDIKAHAEEEAQRTLRDAQSRADLLVERTQGRLEEIQRDIDGLKLKRREVEATIESSVQALRNVLEYVRGHDVDDREEKILFHRPRPAQDERFAEAQG